MADDEFVVFSLDDENIEDLGKVLGTKYSREFLKITQNSVLNLKEIAKIIENNENPHLPNASHHKKRLVKLGLIKAKKKPKSEKGHKLSFFKGKKIIIIVPPEIVDATRNSAELIDAIKHILMI